MAMTLGEKLKAQNEARAAAKALLEQKKLDDTKIEWLENDAHIGAFLNAKAELFTLQIETGKELKTYKLPGYFGANYKWKDSIGRFEIDDHPHYDTIQKFFTWANDNGLIAKIVSEHDGMGMQSWHTLKVEPKV